MSTASRLFLYGWTPLLLEIPQESFSEHQRFSAGEPLLQERGVHRLRPDRRQEADDQHLPPDEVRTRLPTWQKKSLLPMQRARQRVFLQVGSIKSMGQMWDSFERSWLELQNVGSYSLVSAFWWLTDTFLCSRFNHIHIAIVTCRIICGYPWRFTSASPCVGWGNHVDPGLTVAPPEKTQHELWGHQRVDTVLLELANMASFR